MKALKDFIASKLVAAGIKEQNIFYAEPLAKKELLKNIDSASFFDENSDGELSERGYGSHIAGDNSISYSRKLVHKAILKLRIFMQVETLYSRLSRFYISLCSGDTPKGLIALVSEEEKDSTAYYEIKTLKESIEKEVKPGVIEVIISFAVDRYKVYKNEYPIIQDLPMSASIEEV